MRRFALTPPTALARHCQRRWDTSPYRGVHKLTWQRLNAPRWPYGGSVAWRPAWAPEKSFPPDRQLLENVGSVGAPSRIDGDTSEGEAGAAEKAAPQLLLQRLRDCLNLSATDATVLIQRSRVTVNGALQRTNRWIGAADEVTVNGHRLAELADVALVAHKPSKWLLTEDDPLKRLTYTSLLPDARFLAGPAGRIDARASGLLVLTNRRALAAAVSGTSGRLTAVFEVHLRDAIEPEQLAALHGAVPGAAGVLLDVVDASTWDGGSVLHLALHGGLAHHVRVALASAGAPKAASICCLRVGPLTIEDPGLMEPGSVRPLTDGEIAAVLREATAV